MGFLQPRMVPFRCTPAMPDADADLLRLDALAYCWSSPSVPTEMMTSDQDNAAFWDPDSSYRRMVEEPAWDNFLPSTHDGPDDHMPSVTPSGSACVRPDPWRNAVTEVVRILENLADLQPDPAPPAAVEQAGRTPQEPNVPLSFRLTMG